MTNGFVGRHLEVELDKYSADYDCVISVFGPDSSIDMRGYSVKRRHNNKRDLSQQKYCSACVFNNTHNTALQSEVQTE